MAPDISKCLESRESKEGGSSPDELHQYKNHLKKIYGAKTIVNFGAAENYIESFTIVCLGPISNLYFLQSSPSGELLS